MICNNCGQMIPDNSAFCEFCGVNLQMAGGIQQPVNPSGMPMGQQPPMNPSGILTAQQPVNPSGMPIGQQPYGQPQSNYVQPNYNMNKTPYGLIVFIILMICAITTEVILFLAPGVLTKKHREKMIAEEAKPQLEELAKATTEEITTEAPTTTELTTEATTEATTEETTTELTTTEAPVPSAAEEAAAYSTTTRPGVEEFDWYINDAYYNGMWAEAIPITDPAGIAGGWKCLFYWDPENILNAKGVELANVTINMNGTDAEFIVDYYWVQWENMEPYDETGQSVTFYGSFQEGGVIFNEDWCNFYMTGFYSTGVKQYAIGEITVQSGETAYVALVRP